ncbi:hypothetical protein [Pseudomonas sp. 2hn]|uniref:hypothetical protein n=1 Tax=Pseudomonas sp. 2hn TaxID=2866626 RepID=UPI001C7DC20B|nr:hypothetical protein [Pseudomonas sp. 2hn]QZA52637.1 hypothetical protein K2O50_16610 [Pseudomonas sp. 2hn]
MTDFWGRVSELAEDFSIKHNAAKDFLSEHPKLSDESERKKYWELQSAARTAAVRWTEYCSINKPSGF